MAWADIVSQYQHRDKTWADLVDEDEDDAVGELPSDRHASYASALRSGLPSEVQNATDELPSDKRASYANTVRSGLPLDGLADGAVDELPSDTRAPHASALYSGLQLDNLVDDAADELPSDTHASYASALRIGLLDDGIADVRISLPSNPPSHQPGDPVGIQATQSILMSATQKSLSHFHTAGMAGYVYAKQEPSAANAMDSTYTTNNTSMTFESNLDVYTLRKQLVGANLSSFVRTVGSSLTGLPDKENVWYEVSGKEMYEGSLLRIYVDYNKMRDHGLTLEDLARETFKGAKTSVSPDFMGMIDVEIPDVYLSPWLSTMDATVFGTLDILSCDKAALANACTAVTKGTNILAVSRVPGVNKRTITSNNVSNVEAHFGVEAAASVLNSLTKSHIVSDFMTRTGKVLSFMKNSKEVTNKGLLTSMGFERPKDDIKNAIISGQARRVSVYESIITGTDPADDFALLVQESFM